MALFRCFNRLIALISLMVLMSLMSAAHAACEVMSKLSVVDNLATPINVPSFNISSLYLQPAGTAIDGTVVAATLASQLQMIRPAQVIWRCDRVDLNKIYFLVSTNGRSLYNGNQETGKADGLSNVYSTFWKYVGVKHTVGGVEVSRYYRPVAVTSYVQDPMNSAKINIRLMDIPAVEVTLYRLSTLPSHLSGNSNSNGCMFLIDTGMYRQGTGVANGAVYNTLACNQPSMYLQLSGIDNKVIPFAHDNIGDDSAIKFNTSANRLPYGFLNGMTKATKSPACVARNTTHSLVKFDQIAAGAIKAGESSVRDFSVYLECDAVGAPSGTTSGKFAIGFQPSAAAFTAAQRLGLNNANGSGNYLLSDGYGSDPNIAKGVGIQIKNTNTAKQLLFLNKAAIPGGGQAAGWYPVLDGAVYQGVGANPSYRRFEIRYRATLKALPGFEVQAGKVKSTATIVVKIQ